MSVIPLNIRRRTLSLSSNSLLDDSNVGIPGIFKYIFIALGGLMHLHDTGKLVIVLVGLPGRGKTYIGNKLQKYLSWIGYTSKVFTVGNLRRKTEAYKKDSVEYFNPSNPEVFNIYIRWLN